MFPGSTLDVHTKWNSYPHPEGQLYFHRKLPNYDVVTEANIHRQETESRVAGCLKLIDDTIFQQQIIVPPSSELFIELDESPFSCAYYFVNHDARRIFWLEQITTELLDMGTIVSDSHLGVYLNHFSVVYPSHVNRHSFSKTLLGACGVLPNAHV